MHFFFSLLPGPDRVLKLSVAAQVVPLPLEADGSPPSLLTHQPVHARYAAGIVPPDCFGRQHFHTGAVYICQSKRGPRTSRSALTATAFRVSAPEVIGPDHCFRSTVTTAQPGRPFSHILRRGKYGKPAIPLACQIHFFPRMTHTQTSPPYSRVRIVLLYLPSVCCTLHGIENGADCTYS